jgi:hypothetical protein
VCDAGGGGGGGGGRGGGSGGGRGNVVGGGGSHGGGGRPRVGSLTVVGLRRLCEVTRDTCKGRIQSSGAEGTTQMQDARYHGQYIACNDNEKYRAYLLFCQSRSVSG